MTDLISALSCELVNLRPAARHCLTAASQLFLEKMKVIAGNNPSLSSFSTISERVKGFRRINPVIDYQTKHADITELA
jgi:hypothetical protein